MMRMRMGLFFWRFQISEVFHHHNTDKKLWVMMIMGRACQVKSLWKKSNLIEIEIETKVALESSGLKEDDRQDTLTDDGQDGRLYRTFKLLQ